MTSHFFDGSSARHYEITPEIWPGGISFATERGTLAWRYEDLIRLWEYRPTSHLAFTHRQHQDSRLIIEEPEQVAAVGKHAPDLIDRKKEGMRSLRIPALLAIGVLVVIAAIYFLIPPVTDTIARMVPWSVEKAQEPSLASIESFLGKRCNAGRPNEILTALTDRLVAASGFSHAIRVDVLNNKMDNAFALPGGRIVVMRGMIIRAQDPGELAAVLAHEIGHVANRDLTERWIRDHAIGIASSLLLGSDAAGSFGDTLLQAGLGFSFSRADEAAADAYSIRLLNRMDLSTGGGAAFFERLAGKGGLENALPSYFNTHPDSRERARFLRENGTGTKQALTPDEWLILKRICDETD
ncbi:M48 family metallopeptidase [Nisaea acidiphila]|uniref:M48 family metallopeptidase n=1 Tax=Nisaea acidiphila TaxID=1862145 RepID=A0A9J7B0S3_9PROT|nr:M48 family metallopeptidase [Nisaea acidiphila]UUX51285.1 M48 family metallopeptidase [Nisaea acidiphila]